MWKFFHVSFLSLLPLVSAAVEADITPLPVPQLKFEAALNRIDQKVAKLFGEEKQKTLRQIAEAAVLSDYCAAVNLNQVKFKREFEALVSEGEKRKPAEQMDFENRLSMYFGVYVGILVAEGADRRAEFCGFAESALLEHRPISRFWIATFANSSPPSR